MHVQQAMERIDTWKIEKKAKLYKNENDYDSDSDQDGDQQVQRYDTPDEDEEEPDEGQNLVEILKQEELDKNEKRKGGYDLKSKT